MDTFSREFNFPILIKFTLPTIIMMIFMSLYTMIDGVFVANLIGVEAFSAISIAYPAMSAVVAVSIMLASGANSIIARQLGAGESDLARSNFTFIIIVGIICGLLFTAIGVIFINPIVTALGATAEIFDYCKNYLVIIALGSPMAVLQMMFQFLFVTAGKPNLGLISIVLGGVTNIIFDYVFMGVLNIGIAGAGWATIMGYSVPAIFGLFYFSVFRKQSLFFQKFKANASVLLKSCANGSSEMVSHLANSVTMFLFNMVMLKYLGLDGVAAINIVLYVQFFMMSVFLGFSSGIAPVFSYNYGANNNKSLKKLHRLAGSFILGMSVLVFILSFFLSEGIIYIFARPDSAVFTIAKRGCALFSICYLFIGVNIYASSLFTAFSNGAVSATISFLRTFLFLSASILLLPLVLGEVGIWLSVAVAEFATVIVSTFFLYKNRKEIRIVS